MQVKQAIKQLKTSKLSLKDKYDNFIGGKWIAPSNGEYFDNITPITGEVFTKVARSIDKDINMALDAAHKAKDGWAATSTTERANILNQIAAVLEENLSSFAMLETIENGKAIRETTAADMPLAVDHFRYFASCIRAQEGGISEIDNNTIAYHYHEPLEFVDRLFLGIFLF